MKGFFTHLLVLATGLLTSIMLLAVVGCDTLNLVQGNTIRIGAIASLSGPAGNQGKNWLRGAQLAQKELAADGIDVALLVEDDKTNPQEAVKAFHKLVQVEKAQALIGGTWDFLGESVFPLATAARVPFVTPSTPPQILSAEAQESPWIYSNALTMEAERKAVSVFLRAKEIESIVVLYPELPWGVVHAAMLKEAAHEAGATVVKEYPFPMEGYHDALRVGLLKVLEADPDLLYAPVDYGGVDIIVRELARLKREPLVLVSQHLDAAFALNDNPSLFRRCYGVYPEVMNLAFAASYEAEYREPPRVYAAEGYDAVMFLVQALRNNVNFEAPAAKYIYRGITGVHQIPALRGQLVDNKAVIMTTNDGRFARYQFG